MFHRLVEKLQEGAVLGKEPGPSTKRASLGTAKMYHPLWRTRVPASPALQPVGSPEYPKTSHSNLHTTGGALGSGRSPYSFHKRSALDIVWPQGSAPAGNGHS